jgi:predicted transcriptional regulator
MINTAIVKAHQPEVAVKVRQLGACSRSEIARLLKLDPDVIEACLHVLAFKGLIKVQAAVIGRKKKFAFIYWTPTDYKGSYWRVRQRQKAKYPDLFKSRSKKPRVLAKDRIVTHLQDGYERSIDDLCEALGLSYNKVRQSLLALEEEGVVQRRNEIYGRGRPRALWTVRDADDGAVEVDFSRVQEP